jgi:hypothetical protein
MSLHKVKQERHRPSAVVVTSCWRQDRLLVCTTRRCAKNKKSLLGEDFFLRLKELNRNQGSPMVATLRQLYEHPHAEDPTPKKENREKIA